MKKWASLGVMAWCHQVAGLYFNQVIEMTSYLLLIGHCEKIFIYKICVEFNDLWYFSQLVCFGNIDRVFTPQPSGLEGYCRHGPGGRAGGCQTCGTHISVIAWWIFTVRSSVELSRPVVVHCHGHSPICPIWACPWAKNLSNLAQIGSRLCGTHISETAGWIYPIWSFMDFSGPVVVQRHSYLPICPILACPWAKNLSNQAALGPHFAEPISLKPLDGFLPFEVLWNCLDL